MSTQGNRHVKFPTRMYVTSGSLFLTLIVEMYKDEFLLSAAREREHRMWIKLLI